jgi:hypothetical protein
MRGMKRALLAFTLVAGCSSGGGGGGNHDFAQIRDLSQNNSDFAELPDLAQTPDDLSRPPNDFAGGICNNLVDVSFGVTCQQTPMVGPQPMGGPIPAGTYALVDCVIFTGQGGAQGPLGAKVFQTLALANGRYDAVSHFDVNQEVRTSGTWSTANGQITTTAQCPMAGMPSTATYTAYQTSFSVIISNGNTTTLTTYSLR